MLIGDDSQNKLELSNLFFFCNYIHLYFDHKIKAFIKRKGEFIWNRKWASSFRIRNKKQRNKKHIFNLK